MPPIRQDSFRVLCCGLLVYCGLVASSGEAAEKLFRADATVPDIFDLRTTTPEQVLIAILDPNRAIDAAYFRYVVLTDNGQVFEGLLEDGHGKSVTLLMQEGKRKTIARERIETLEASGVSMMPNGFEQQLSPDAMRDLVAFVKNWRYMKTEIPQNE